MSHNTRPKNIPCGKVPTARKLHKVVCPNGIVFWSEWYYHPWLGSDGLIRRQSVGDPLTLSFPFYDRPKPVKEKLYVFPVAARIKVRRDDQQAARDRTCCTQT